MSITRIICEGCGFTKVYCKCEEKKFTMTIPITITKEVSVCLRKYDFKEEGLDDWSIRNDAMELATQGDTIMKAIENFKEIVGIMVDYNLYPNTYGYHSKKAKEDK